MGIEKLQRAFLHTYYLLQNFIKVNTIFLLVDYLCKLGIMEGIKGELNLFRKHRFQVYCLAISLYCGYIGWLRMRTFLPFVILGGQGFL